MEEDEPQHVVVESYADYSERESRKKAADNERSNILMFLCIGIVVVAGLSSSLWE